MFELLGANLFRRSPQGMRPTKSNHPGYDAVLTVQDGATADISLKSYGTSSHEMTFREQAARAEEAFPPLLVERKEGGVFFAIAKGLSLDAGLGRASQCNSHACPGQVSSRRHLGREAWFVAAGFRAICQPTNFLPSVPGCNRSIRTRARIFPTSSTRRLRMLRSTPLKRRTAFVLFSCVSRRRCRSLLVMNGPRTTSRTTRKARSMGVYLYQIASIDAPNGTSIIGHSFGISETPEFANWRNARTPKGPLSDESCGWCRHGAQPIDCHKWAEASHVCGRLPLSAGRILHRLTRSIPTSRRMFGVCGILHLGFFNTLCSYIPTDAKMHLVVTSRLRKR